MDIGFDRRGCFERAKALLAGNDESGLRYTCLELRFCLEAIAYDKLKLYAGRLPTKVLETWQPPQAMRALLEYEPSANENFTLAVCLEDASGRPTGKWEVIGKHHAFNLSWLRTTYNKLGSFLHLPAPRSATALSSQTPASLRKALQDIVKELEPIVCSSLDSALAQVVDFECSVCHDQVIANMEGVRRRRAAVCLNPNCRAEYVPAESENGEFTFHLKTSLFDCQTCGHKNPIENRKLEIGLIFKCERCGEEHKFLTRHWGYSRVKDMTSTG